LSHRIFSKGRGVNVGVGGRCDNTLFYTYTYIVWALRWKWKVNNHMTYYKIQIMTILCCRKLSRMKISAVGQGEEWENRVHVVGEGVK
jgi:hypothetical protein